MEKTRNMKLPSLCCGLMILFTLLMQTLHASTLPLGVHHDPLGVRRDLRPINSTSNKKLRIGLPKPYGYHELVNMEHNSTTNETVFSGYCIDVFLAAIRGLTYEIDYEFIPFVDVNGNSAGTYNDLVYQIYLQEFDVVVGDITITAYRSKYAEFTMAFTDVGVGTMTKKVDQNDLWIFLRPFDKNLWLTCIAFFIFTGFVVWVIEHPSNSEFQGSQFQQIGTIIWFGFSTLVFAQREKLSSNISKFMILVWVFVVLILTSYYTAYLTSLLTVEQIQLKTLGGNIGYGGSSIMQDLIVDNLNFENYELRPYRRPEEYANALSRGTKNGGTAAIIDEIPYLKVFLAKYPDGYTLVKSTTITNGFGFAFRKGSSLVPDVSREIAKLRESGELMKLEDKWIKGKSTLVNQRYSVNNSLKPLDLHRFRSLFLITGFSSTLALFYKLFRPPPYKSMNKPIF